MMLIMIYLRRFGVCGSGEGMVGMVYVRGVWGGGVGVMGRGGVVVFIAGGGMGPEARLDSPTGRQGPQSFGWFAGCWVGCAGRCTLSNMVVLVNCC